MATNPGRCSSGVPGLDEVLAGGLIAERMYLVDGNPGAGKTTLAMQFLMQGARSGERCMYVTLSETALELRASAAAHGWSLDGIDIIELIVDERALQQDTQLTMLHASEIDLNELTRNLVAALDAHSRCAWCSTRCPTCGCSRSSRCATGGRSSR